MRLIDADDLKDLVYIACMGQDKAFIKVFEQAIDDCPTINPESLIPHGKWIEGKEIAEGTEIPIGVCSMCGDSYNLEEFPFATLCDYFIYCPNCGAKMDKEDPDAG